MKQLERHKEYSEILMRCFCLSLDVLSILQGLCISSVCFLKQAYSHLDGLKSTSTMQTLAWFKTENAHAVMRLYLKFSILKGVLWWGEYVSSMEILFTTKSVRNEGTASKDRYDRVFHGSLDPLEDSVALRSSRHCGTKHGMSSYCRYLHYMSNYIVMNEFCKRYGLICFLKKVHICHVM